VISKLGHSLLLSFLKLLLLLAGSHIVQILLIGDGVESSLGVFAHLDAKRVAFANPEF